jgi:hypothetical protein
MLLTNKSIVLLHCDFNLSLKMASEQTDMTEVVDLSALPPNVPSLCIPRVFKNITRERVFNCFKDLGIGFVERIDMVPRKTDNGEEFQRVFVHLRWNRSEQASKARSRVLAGKEIKIIYDEPWFWKVSANRSVSRDARDSRDARPGDRPRATLALDDDIEASMRKIKAQNDRDRKDGRFPSGHQRRQNERQDRRRDQRPRDQRPRDQRPRDQRPVEKSFEPRSPSSSPPPAQRSPSPDLISEPSPSPSHEHSSSYDVDAPTIGTTAGGAIDYGDCSKLPIVKRKRVVKKPLLLEPSAELESGEEKEKD